MSKHPNSTFFPFFSQNGNEVIFAIILTFMVIIVSIYLIRGGKSSKKQCENEIHDKNTEKMGKSKSIQDNNVALMDRLSYAVYMLTYYKKRIEKKVF